MDFDDVFHKILALSHDVVVHPLSQFFLNLEQADRAVFYILLAIATAFGFVIGCYGTSRSSRTREFQNRGEALVSRLARMTFGPPDYHLMNHITLQMEDGTTQVDHVLVSRFGVFVIETKACKGWIFADAKQRNWTQVMFRLKFKFQNPIHQNMRHVRAVQGLLDFLPPGAIKSIVVFTGEAEFKTEVPQGVLTISELADYLRNHTDKVLSLNRVQFCVGRLETARLAISGETDVEHVQSLARRHGGAT